MAIATHAWQAQTVVCSAAVGKFNNKKEIQMSRYRVMQVQETGEECNVFEGTGSECEDWIDNNEDNYPESQFYMETVIDYREAAYAAYEERDYDFC
jgi:hypothetical protein